MEHEHSGCGPVAYDAPAVERGVGFFETVLLTGRRAVLWDQHLARLLGSLERLQLPAPARDEIELASSTAAGDDAGERALRLSWVAIAADIEKRSSWRLDVSVRAIPESTLVRRHGSRAMTLPAEFVRDTATVKSTSYFAAVLGLRHAKKQGCDEGLFVTRENTYLEGTSTAIAAWNGGAWLVAESGFLPSVTAAAFLRGRQTSGWLGREEVRYGAVLLGSLTKVAPVVSLDGEPCNVPLRMREEAEAFNDRLLSDPSLSHLL
jgi:4-amino-4-deoxychorismate lyase